MTYDPARHHRRSIRLHGYDYSQAGAYFVTICVQQRECLLGEITDDAMRLSDAGRMVQEIWYALPGRFPYTELDEFMVMPTHVHGIIVTTDATTGATTRVAPTSAPHVGAGLVPASIDTSATGATTRVAPTPSRPTLGGIVSAFKSMTTHEYVMGVRSHGWIPFPGKLWQRNYYEHIIRSERELDAIRAYIATNPLRWALDAENPLTRKATVPEVAWQR